MFANLISVYRDHNVTFKGLLGVVVADLAAWITPTLTVLVLCLTAWNLALEIRKKSKKDV